MGYTATPFANVFIDPSDNDDIFPQHFIVALSQPKSYMGASSFFDLPDEETQWSLSNREAYIRELHAKTRDDHAEREELKQALAAFLVTGAIKLYRQKKDPSLSKAYRHHTMLIHDAQQKAAHADRAEKVISVWESSHWESAEGEKYLKSAFDDIRPTLEDRGDSSGGFVDSFEEVRDFIPEVIRRVETLDPAEPISAKNCVIVVNSDTVIERRLDFDRRATWKIVVGGALLSRGFTIEGLTVTYFRRLREPTTRCCRWVGGSDIGLGTETSFGCIWLTSAPFSKSKTVSLYDAFVSIAKGEKDFREQLSKYSGWEGNSPAITPREVRPLVCQSLPWLKPTSPNKMQNARLVRQRESVFSPKAMSNIASEVKANWRATLRLVKSAREHIDVEPSSAGFRRMSAWVGVVPAEDVVKALRSLKWLDEYFDNVVRPKVNYYEHSFQSGALDDFLLVFPQTLDASAGVGQVSIASGWERTTVKRTRDGNQYYGEYTDPSHREVALSYIGPEAECSTSLLPYRQPVGRGVILAYLIPEQSLTESRSSGRQAATVSPDVCSVGLTIYLPGSATSAGDQDLVFEAIDHSTGK